MSTTLARRRTTARLAALALALGAFGVVDAAAGASDASAAGCSYSNLSSTKVKNVNCTRGAYGYKKTATATNGVRLASWVSAGSWSYNPYQVCYQYPTMVFG